MFLPAEQFDVRYEQGVYVFGEVPYVYHDKARTVQSISKYIKSANTFIPASSLTQYSIPRFHNCVWLVLNDVIIGVAFGSFLCENQRFFGRHLHYGLQTYLIDGMQRALLWLNNWPAGLKLNTELSQFYCHSLVGAVSLWGCTSPPRPLWMRFDWSWSLNRAPEARRAVLSRADMGHRRDGLLWDDDDRRPALRRAERTHRAPLCMLLRLRDGLQPPAKPRGFALEPLPRCVHCPLIYAGACGRWKTCSRACREAVQRPAEPDRLVGLRPRPAPPRHDSFPSPRVPLPDRAHVLCTLCHGWCLFHPKCHHYDYRY